MTGLPQAAIDAAMDTIERLGAGGSRTTVRIVLEAAAPHIAAAERERLAALGDAMDARDAIRAVKADAATAERERILNALPSLVGSSVAKIVTDALGGRP